MSTPAPDWLLDDTLAPDVLGDPLQPLYDAAATGDLALPFCTQCGLPLDLEGEEGEWAAEVRAFGAELVRRFSLPIHWVDERLSSVMAEHAVRGIGLKRGQREEKGRVDSAAAALILQAFLRTRHRLNAEAAQRASDDESGAQG